MSKYDQYRIMANQAIQRLVDSGAVRPENIAIREDALAASFLNAERNYDEQRAPSNVHLVVALSGRTDFKTGAYLETNNKDKSIFCPNAFEPVDTIRRTRHAIFYAITCMKNSMLNDGIFKPVFVYFNGGDDQNAELQEILDKQGHYLGLPASFFIIRSLPIVNTMGQVLDLSEFFEHEWPKYCKTYKLDPASARNIAVFSSTYHVTRIKFAMVNTSPLHTGAYWDSYWENNAEVRDRVSQRFSGMIEYSLNPGERLKTANIMVAGCDRDILGRPFGWKDAYCDMQAAVRYASKEELPHPPMKSLKVPTSPSIASSTKGRNIVNFFGHDRSDTLILRSTIAQSMRYLFHRPCESKKNTQEKVRNYKFDL